MAHVAVVDYGIGNLLSVCRALAYCGAEVGLTDSAEGILSAGYLVLPGVGAFADGMEGLRQRRLIKAIQSYALSGRPFLGICLGMQLMMESSEEFGQHEGLGLIPGKVIAIPPSGTDGTPHKIPHIGWNGLLKPYPGKNWQGTILQGLQPEDAVYFVHSFTCVPAQEKFRLADCIYDGRIISAAVHSGALHGCQFHPEKSGPVGLQLIKNFLDLHI
jgi:glutamine amidotransferase